MVNVPFRQIIGLNQQTYQRLSLSLHLNLRRQIFIAVCDDLILRDRLASQLQTEFNPPNATSVSALAPSQPYPHLVSLQLSLDDPNPLLQIAQWLTHSPPPIGEDNQVAIPAFQILGIEHLTRQSPGMQRLFFTHLQTIEQNLPMLDFSILLWMTQPWFHTLPDSVPEFWRCRTGVFEFIGDPTPLTITSPERFGAQSSQPILSSQSSQSSQLTLPSTQLSTQLANTVDRLSEEESSELQDALAQDALAQDFLAQQQEFLSQQSVLLSNSTTAVPPELPLEKPSEPPPEDLEQTDPAHLTALEPIEDQLQEEPETEGLTQAEISMLLGEGLSASPTKRRKRVKPATTQPPVKTTKVLENPWLALGEALDQPYESSESIAISSELYTSEETAIEPDRTAKPDLVSPRQEIEAEPEGSPETPPELPFTPIQLPEGLPEREQIQSILQKIEQLHQQRASLLVLVDAYRSLGNLFRDRIEQGEVTPQNLIVAIQAYEQALLRLPDNSPLWVDILNDLGNLYWMASRSTPNAAESLACLNQAVQSYQFALTKIDPQTQSHTAPMVQNNLGAAYADLARHDKPVENLELSVQSYRQALEYRKPETDPLRYASTQNNLGTTYWNLAQHKEAAANLKLAIIAYSEALQYYNPSEEPLNYAMIQNNLGTAYWNLAQHERSQDWLMAAVSAYQMALTYRTLEANPVAHAATQNNLGTAYWHIANETESAEMRVECLQQAIESYKAALQAVQHLQTHQPQAMAMLNFDTFATHNNLGLAYYQTATDTFSSLDTAKQSHCLEASLDQHVLAWHGWVENSNLRQTAFNCIVQTIQAAYNQLGLSGQNMALSRVPGELLPEILSKL